MKLHRIEVDNLNSLYGEQVLDLDTQLDSAPMFLIYGRTGAGKSTLLDAVCLALFGQTPRLDRGRGEELQPHQIMSKGTASCRAALEFSLALQGGRERYRASWSCRRARGKLEGKLQDPIRRLEIQRRDPSGAYSWETLIETAQVGAAEQHFSDALRGLTVDDFKRSILLAQGEFAAFLRATEDERSKMLERLTDTGQYAVIGRRAGEVFRQKRDEVGVLRSRVAQIPVLGEAEAAEAYAELLKVDAEISALERAQSQRGAAVRWTEELLARAERAKQSDAHLLAASDALTAAQPQLGRLGEHRRCLEGAAALSTVLREEGELVPIDAMLAQIAVQLDDLSRAERGQIEALDRADATLAEAQAALTAATPEIQRARVLRQAALTAGAEAQTAEAETAAKEEERSQQQQEHTRALESHAAMQRQLEEAQRATGLLSQAEPLVEQVSVWQSIVERIADQGAALGRQHDKIEEERLLVASARERLGQAVGEEARIQEALDLTAARAAEAEAALAAIHQASPTPDAPRRGLEEQRDDVQAKIQRLERLATPIERLQSIAEALLKLEGEGAKAESERATLRARLPDLDALEQAHSQALASANEVLIARKLLLDLASRRDALREDEPCPLCGSLDHPWRGIPPQEGAPALVTAAEESRREVDERLQQTRQERSATTVKLEGLDVQLRNISSSLSIQKSSFYKYSSDLDVELRAAGLPPQASEVSPAEVEALCAKLQRSVEALRAALNLTLAHANEALNHLDKATESVRDSAKQLATAHEALRQRERATLSARGELQRAEEKLANHLQAHAELGAQIDADRRALQAALDAAGLPTTKGALDARVREATRLVSDWRRALAAEQTAREALQVAERAVAVGQRGVEVSVRVAEEAQQRTEERRKQADIAMYAANQILNGQDPDERERALEQARRQAEAIRGRAAEALEATRRRTSQLVGQRQIAQAQQDTLIAQLTGSRQALETALAVLGLPDRGALAGRTLQPEEVNALAKQEHRLQQGLTEAQTRRQDAQAALTEHQSARPEGAPDDEDGLASAKLDLVNLEAQRTDRLQRQGSLRERLTQHEQNLRRLGAAKDELIAAQQDLTIWENINNLIGTNNGDAFRKYAQILNLEDLLQRANQRLRWLAPRYLLAPAKGPNGEERLAFAVQDEHHAHEERPLTTLSGGETFLVSLALALALAEYRTLQAPIETLLLDEGFGTLDTDTLNTVMDALEKLQARGARIGLISHVDGLRERIEARVAVEAVGHGRSRLRVELGAAHHTP